MAAGHNLLRPMQPALSQLVYPLALTAAGRQAATSSNHLSLAVCQPRTKPPPVFSALLHILVPARQGCPPAAAIEQTPPHSTPATTRHMQSAQPRPPPSPPQQQPSPAAPGCRPAPPGPGSAPPPPPAGTCPLWLPATGSGQPGLAPLASLKMGVCVVCAKFGFVCVWGELLDGGGVRVGG